VLDAVGFRADYVHCEIGWFHWVNEGNALPDRTLRSLEKCDAGLLGAITSKPAEEAELELSPRLRGQGLTYASPIVRLRQHFDLYAAIRPCRTMIGACDSGNEQTDIVVFRENTEGLYAGVEWDQIPEPLALAMRDQHTGHPEKMKRWDQLGYDQVAMSTRLMSRRGCERIIVAGFEYARQHNRSRVMLVEKPNVLRATGGLMTRVFHEIADRYPDIETREENIDAACMKIVRDPTQFDVIVAENMFGDILSDLGAGLVGGLGFTPSANIGERFGIFEPTHGSAPDIAGRGIANPTAAILSAAMMLEHLGHHGTGMRIRSAVESAIASGGIRTPDIATSDGTGTTDEATMAIIDQLPDTL
jgi:3-isopropylmalate dehydrogenase